MAPACSTEGFPALSDISTLECAICLTQNVTRWQMPVRKIPQTTSVKYHALGCDTFSGLPQTRPTILLVPVEGTSYVSLLLRFRGYRNLRQLFCSCRRDASETILSRKIPSAQSVLTNFQAQLDNLRENETTRNSVIENWPRAILKLLT